MKKSILLIFLVFFIHAFISCKKEKNNTKETYITSFKPLQEYYLEKINNSISLLEELREHGAQGDSSKIIFRQLREEFKKAEPYASYLNPEVGHKVNGPALPNFKEDNFKVLPPVGLQKIEESIFTGEATPEEFEYETRITLGMLNVLKKSIEKREPNAQRFFVATHQQLLRIVTHSVSGFDTPVSHLGINEAAVSLKSLLEVYEIVLSPIILKKDETLHKSFKEQVNQSIAYIERSPDFESFDRFTFIKDHLNAVTANWVEIRKASCLWDGSNDFPFNFDAPTFFEENSFNLTYFIPPVNRNFNAEQVALGEKLFFDPKLSRSNTMSCATCHNPKKAYADGLIANLDNTGNPLGRNTPTLFNVAYQQAFFWDGRSENLMDQITSVFVNKKEFNSDVHSFSDKILSDSSYIPLFEKAFGKVPANNSLLVKAISSYVSTLNSFNSKFDKNIRSQEATFTSVEKLGFNLFMGKALCATCHFMPLTNGTVPPFFTEMEKEVIGVPKTADNKTLDDDLGLYWKYEQELQRGMFKTPTVRNAELTAPYMHNGVYQTLDEVVNFYNLGGGNGLGFDIEYQTLPFDNLSLSDEEQKALVAFMKTLNSTDVKPY